MTLTLIFLFCLSMKAQVKAWEVTSYYKTFLTTVSTVGILGQNETNTVTTTIPVLPTAQVSTLSISTVIESLQADITVLEVFVPTDAPVTTTTTPLFDCDSSRVNTCTGGAVSYPTYIDFFAYVTITAPSYCSNSFSYVSLTYLDQSYELPSEITSQVLQTASYKTTYVGPVTGLYGGYITNDQGEYVSATYVDVFVPTNLYTATTADPVSALASQCIDPRNTADGSGTICLEGPEGPTQGCPTSTLPSLATMTAPLIDTSVLLSAISSAEASATGGGKKNDSVRVGGDRDWVLLGVLLCGPFLMGILLL